MTRAGRRSRPSHAERHSADLRRGVFRGESWPLREVPFSQGTTVPRTPPPRGTAACTLRRKWHGLGMTPNELFEAADQAILAVDQRPMGARRGEPKSAGGIDARHPGLGSL